MLGAMAGVKVYEPTDGTDVEVEIQGDGTRRQVVKALITDLRGLTERMFARAPQVGYSLWLDTADVTYIYIAEAVSTETAGTASTFQGIRVQKDVAGNPLGKVQVATAFAWTARATAGWA